MFYISLLKPWHSRRNNLEPQLVLIDDKEEWEVNEIRDKRVRSGEPKYLISQKDSPPYEDSQEPIEHLKNTKGAIEVFERARDLRKPKAKAKKKGQVSQRVKKRGRPRKEKQW